MAKRLTSEKNAEKKQVRVVRVGTLLDFKGPNSVRHRLGCAGR